MTVWDRAAGVWRLLPQPARIAALRLVNHKVTLGCVGLIDDGEGRVLILDHRFRPRWSWGLPGGFLGPGEALVPALKREIAEETGLQIEVDPAPFDVEHLVGPGMVTVAFTARAVAPGALALSPEIRGGGFLAPSELPAGTYPHHAELVARWSARKRT